jgi:anti-sigma B factor antagonist
MLSVEASAMSRHIEPGGDRGAASEPSWYRVDQMDGCAVVHATGEIDAHTVHAFHETVAEAGSLASHVIIDLADVTFVDSSGLGGLIVARKSAQQGGGSLSLVSPPPMVRRLLGSTQLHDIFTIYDSLDEAATPQRNADSLGQTQSDG